MSSEALHHNQQQLFHNRYEYDYRLHNGYIDGRAEVAHQVVECHLHEEEVDRQSEAIIRGNMQYVNGEMRKIPRPLNAFMIFSNEKRKELKKEYPGEPNNMISSRLGAAWKALSDESRKKYHDMAHREDLEHRRKYPNYQYCPGHARKLKKARREQRLRQQGMYRGTRQPSRGVASLPKAMTTRKRTEMAKQQASASSTSGASTEQNAKREDGPSSSPSGSKKMSSNQIVHGLPKGVVSTSVMPGPFGEGRFSNSSTTFMPPDVGTECMLSCCSGCKPADIYCCPETHWNAEALVGPHSFSPGPYPPPMLYFSPGYESQFTGDALPPQPCLMSGDCNGCYPAAGYVDGCYGSLYPAGGDASMCFMPEMPMTTSPPLIVTSAGCVRTPMSDGDAELTDLSNSMVPSSCSQGSQASSHESCASKSPSTLQDISPPSSLSMAETPSTHDM